MLIHGEHSSVFDYGYADFELTDYDPMPHIKAEVAV